MANWVYNASDYTARNFELIPEGDHRVRIKNVIEKVFSTGNEGFEITLDVPGYSIPRNPQKQTSILECSLIRLIFVILTYHILKTGLKEMGRFALNITFIMEAKPRTFYSVLAVVSRANSLHRKSTTSM